MKQAREDSLATSLFIYLASGGALHHLLDALPASRTRLQAAFDSMVSNAGCGVAAIQQRADRLREVIVGKDDAINRCDFDRAAELRAEECALFESMGLRAPIGETWHTVLRVGIEEQVKQLSGLICQSE